MAVSSICLREQPRLSRSCAEWNTELPRARAERWASPASPDEPAGGLSRLTGKVDAEYFRGSAVHPEMQPGDGPGHGANAPLRIRPNDLGVGVEGRTVVLLLPAMSIGTCLAMFSGSTS